MTIGEIRAESRPECLRKSQMTYTDGIILTENK